MTALHYAIIFMGMFVLVMLSAIFFKSEWGRGASLINEQSTQIIDLDVATGQNVDEKKSAAWTLSETNIGSEVSSDEVSAKLELEQDRLSAWISKRYRIANDATRMMVSTAFITAQKTKLDPLLILAVVAIESRFNPIAESPVGAKGLMQVMYKVHQQRFEELKGNKSVLNPAANMMVGSQILKEYISFGGSLEAGLKIYVGAADLNSDQGYGSKVIAEYRLLKDIARGKRTSISA